MSEKEKNRSEESEVENKVVKEKKGESPKTSSKASKKQNVVYIGNKPPMNYVMAVITAFNMGNGTEVTLKARGRAISTAVDVAEITRNRFLKDAKMFAISIGTEEITPREGGNPRNVSTMEISLKQ
ncbi:MAG: DNA-binding protein Alba [Candidatus Bathyarchaeota archaeon]|jgi:DNA-binding protein|nr:MAG: DNA-binding protein Alba [Candidatus Bathyarchaeota archaeon]